MDFEEDTDNVLQMTISLYVLDCYGARIAASAVSATRISGYLGGAVFPLFAIQSKLTTY